jgi:hypothetical protein
MWLPDESQMSKALRVLADGNYLHTRDYGSGKQEDFRV